MITPSNLHDEILSTTWFPIYRGLIIVFGFPKTFPTMSLHFFGQSLILCSIQYLRISLTATSNRLLELCDITSKTVASATYFNLECQSPSSLGFFCSINHFSGGGANANNNTTHSLSFASNSEKKNIPENDSRLLKNSEENRDGERNFCQEEPDIALSSKRGRLSLERSEKSLNQTSVVAELLVRA